VSSLPDGLPYGLNIFCEKIMDVAEFGALEALTPFGEECSTLGI